MFMFLLRYQNLELQFQKMRDKSDVNCMRTITYVCNANCNELSNLAGPAIKEPLRPSEQYTWRNGNKSNIAYPYITTKQVALYIIKYSKFVYIFWILSRPSKNTKNDLSRHSNTFFAWKLKLPKSRFGIRLTFQLNNDVIRVVITMNQHIMYKYVTASGVCLWNSKIV